MKKLLLIALIFPVIAGNMFAQAVPGGFESPTSEATNGLFTSTADDFISPTNYADAEFENWFAFTSFAPANAVSPYNVNVGYAKKGKNMYIGLYYGGFFWQDVRNISYEEQYTSWHGEDKNGVKVYTASPFLISPAAGNQISVLVGMTGMGFRLSFFSNLNVYSDKDFIFNLGVVDKEYSTVRIANGTLSPQLAWGMTQDLMGKGIRPWITIDLDINSDYAKGQTYYEDPANPGKYITTDEEIYDSSNSVEPTLELGLGGFNLYEKNGFSYSVDLGYRLNTAFYSSEYSYESDDTGDKYKTANFKGTGGSHIDENDILYENTGSVHVITPSFSGSWTGEKLALAFTLSLPVGITSNKRTPMGLEVDDTNTSKYNGKLVQNGAERKTSGLWFFPELALAMQWHIVPKLALNAGGMINLTTLGRVTTETGKDYDNGKAIDNSHISTSVNTYHNGDGSPSHIATVGNSLSLGVSFAPINNLTFEAVCGVTSTNGISVFNITDGLFVFSNILVSLKF